jgi:hypothetical protein
MRIDYVQQHAGNAAVYIRKRQRPYAHQCLEKFNIFTSESTKKQEKRGKEVAGWRFLQKIPSFTKKTCKNFPLLQNSCKNFPLLQKSPKKSKKTSLFYKKTSLFYKKNFPLLQKTKKNKTSLFYKKPKKPKNQNVLADLNPPFDLGCNSPTANPIQTDCCTH